MLLWGVIMTTLALIPVVGTALVWGPVAVYLLLTGDYWDGGILLAYGSTMVGLADNILRPLLVGRDTKLPNFLVLLSTSGGFVFFDMDGFVTGPTLVVLFVAVWQIFIVEFGTNAPASPAASAIPGVIPIRPQPDSSAPTKVKKSKTPRKSQGQR